MVLQGDSMHFLTAADTDIGNCRLTNQDSLLIRHAASSSGEILMAAVCDGMGGLQKGEVASASAVMAFSKWFDERLPCELECMDMDGIAQKWSAMLKDLNQRIGLYGQERGMMMGSTFTGVLFIKDRYIAVHVGDTRIYQIDSAIRQLTQDQTFVAREVHRGHMTPAQARVDKRRNMLLQCVGASRELEPQILQGSLQPAVYMICSDGFRHEVTEQEIQEAFQPAYMTDQASMHQASMDLIHTVKARGEKDNISVILIRVQ